MSNSIASLRLRKEYIAIQKDPIENIETIPLETNILEWHYVIIGTKDTPFEGGYYHGILRFPKEYPMKPPSVIMITENGRFAINRRICLSMSDFHPETWNPMWSVSSILTGLYSFMLENKRTQGSIETDLQTKRRLALKSLETNCQCKVFSKCFPDLVALNAIKKIEKKENEERKRKKEQENNPQILNLDNKKKKGKINQSTGDDNINKYYLILNKIGKYAPRKSLAIEYIMGVLVVLFIGVFIHFKLS